MLVVGERVGHRALVAVVGGEVEDVVEVVGQRSSTSSSVIDASTKRDAGSSRDVLALGREQVVDDEDARARRARAARARGSSRRSRRRRRRRIRRATERPLAHCAGTFRCVNVCSMPYSR